ncbi:CPBP family intramembrane metalloprotease [Vibrio parahaemolyticus]|nr:CPBP family intramembrane metalloprotease [Vibrio parahaemolyticus]
MKIFSFLFHTNQSEIGYVVKSYLLHACVTFPLVLGASYIWGSEFAALDGRQESSLLFLIILAPAIETLLMVPILKLIQMFKFEVVMTSVISALIWGVAHTLNSVLNGFGVLFLFFVLSISYLTWRQKSFKAAFGVTFGIHALNNAVVFLS